MMTLDRRELFGMTGGALLALSGAGSAKAQPAAPFGYEQVVAKARALAAAPHAPSDRSLPASLADLSYDDYRRINFRSDHTLLQGPNSNFGLQLFHRGGIFRRRTIINIVAGGEAHAIPYSVDQFDFGAHGPPRDLPSDLGYAGLRLLYPLNHSGKLDELVSFLGASYFRFLGKNQNYGLSARGIAIGTGSAHEEFPDFIEFWVETPDAPGHGITVHALMDGPSITGAYRFVFNPATDDAVDIQATLFARNDIAGLGFAPLTSMFLHGKNSLRRQPDFRPEVHDSDGLAILGGSGEWRWRPLRNPSRPTISLYPGTDIRGFGLLQRERDFSHYQDLEAHYDRRPGYWVELRTRLGNGDVQLVELPTRAETDDNVVTSFVPQAQPRAGDEMRISYIIRAVDTPLHDIGTVVASFETHAAAAPSPGQDGRWRMIIDFAGGRLAETSLAVDRLDLAVELSRGRVAATTLVRNPAVKGVRATLDIDAPQGDDIAISAILREGGTPLAERWLYRLETNM